MPCSFRVVLACDSSKLSLRPTVHTFSSRAVVLNQAFSWCILVLVAGFGRTMLTLDAIAELYRQVEMDASLIFF